MSEPPSAPAIVAARGDSLGDGVVDARQAAGHAVVRECPTVVDLTGDTSLDVLATVLVRADAVCFPRTVPELSWRPWMVPHVVLDGADPGCAPCSLKECPFPSHPCGDLDGHQVVAAVESLIGAPAALVRGGR